MVNKTNREIYDELAKTYDDTYVEGEDNKYMKDERLAFEAYQMLNAPKSGFDGKIISLGCGTGQDIDILDFPLPSNFVGIDISSEMLKKAQAKHPHHTFVRNDLSETFRRNIDTLHLRGDRLVSMFGTPNYIGIGMLTKHYKDFGCKSAFFIFYNSEYDDGVVDKYYSYTHADLHHAFKHVNPYIFDLKRESDDTSDYIVVMW